METLSKFKVCGMVNTPATGKLIYLMLGELAGSNGEIIIPQRKICNALRISKSAASRNLRRLERAGAISIAPAYHPDGGRAPNKYYVK